MTALILQARLDSSRLPRKALLPLDGKPLLLCAMEALKNIRSDFYILACSGDAFNDFKPLAQEAGFKIFAGSNENVLNRYCSAIRHFDIDKTGKDDTGRIIRATGDNPFVFTDAADLINDEACRLGADYAGFAGLPYGAGVESVRISALLKAEREAASGYDLEHVCPYLYTNPDKFYLHRPLCPKQWQFPKLRLTVDTNEDYEYAKVIYSHLNKIKDIKDRTLGKNIIGVCDKIKLK